MKKEENGGENGEDVHGFGERRETCAEKSRRKKNKQKKFPNQ